MANRNLKMILLILATVVILSLPTSIVILLGWKSAGMFAFLAAMAGLFGGAGLGWRGIWWVTLVASLSTGVAVLVSTNPWGSAALMMCVGIVAGFSNLRGLASWSFMFPMITGAAIGQPPSIIGTKPIDALFVVGICAASILISGALTMLVVKRGMQKTIPTFPRTVNLVYTVNLAVLLAIAGFVASYYKAEFMGMWFALTIVVIVHPYFKESVLRGLQRGGGTIVGFLIAIGVAYTFTGAIFYIAAGLIFLCIAVFQRMRDNNAHHYWIYVLFLTPGVVLLSTTQDQVVHLAHERLLATSAAAIICLLVMGIEGLIFRRGGLAAPAE